MNAYYKETEKPFGNLLVDNKPHAPPDKQVLADLLGECYVTSLSTALSPHVLKRTLQASRVQHQSQKARLYEKHLSTP